MTVEQEIRAAALQAAATIMAPQIAVHDFDPDTALADFRDAVERYENYIKHGEWNE